MDVDRQRHDTHPMAHGVRVRHRALEAATVDAAAVMGSPHDQCFCEGHTCEGGPRQRTEAEPSTNVFVA